jgi:hypothetical protein
MKLFWGNGRKERETIGAFAVALLGKAPQSFESPPSMTLQKLLEVETV